MPVVTVTETPSSVPLQQNLVNHTILNTDPDIVYSPPTAWHAGSIPTCANDGSFDETSNTVGSSFSFNFTGVAVYIFTATTPDSGDYQVFVDDGTQGIANNDGFSPSVVACALGYIITGLQNQPHAVKVEITGPSAQSTTQGTALNFDSITFTSVDAGNQGQGGEGTGEDTGAAELLQPVWLWSLLTAVLSLPLTL